MNILTKLLLTSLTLLVLSACGGGGSDSLVPAEPETSSTWGEMKWGEGTWGK